MNKKSILIALLALVAIVGLAQKRVNNRMYNPDPAPVVSGDRLYVFTGHDLDTATYFRMPDWQLFSTTDMEHWTDHGVVMSTANFKWAKQGDNAWASQAIERNGKWYWYVAAEDTTKHLHGIGVAVADRPEGPWADPIGKPLIPGDWGFIDPTVFIDDDGQAYLFWGNNGCWYAKLNEDMISIDKSFANNGICDMRPMLDDEAQFGPKCMKMDYQLHKRVMKTGFEEAPWLYKIGDTYFLEYAAGGVPEHWAYSTSKSIHGPWHYEGRITDEAPGSFTIHGGTIDFKGKSYLFYHDGIPSGGNGFRRTTAFREFKRLKDGRIPKINIKQESAQGPRRGFQREAFTTETPMAHDPVMAKEGDTYYLYATGMGIQQMTSKDRKTWTVLPQPVMTVIPGWTTDSVPGFRSHVWAPDVIQWHGTWWLAYSCSTFGKNGSAIGLLSSRSLRFNMWKDEGCIVASHDWKRGADGKMTGNNWNAIDPNFVIDDNDQPWLVWGSFWDGIQLARLDTTMHIYRGEKPRTIARRYDPSYKPTEENPTSKYAGTNAIEAPFIFKHGGYYYLFVSWDYCCRGAKSNYRVAVGRSKTVEGPYLDRAGKDMVKGGGTIVLEGDKKEWEAAGHCAVYTFDGEDVFICHGYSATQNGSAFLIQRPIRWTSDGWPELRGKD